MDKVRLQIGGSPCTNWSIAQTSNRETTPEGIGWELFLNYVIAAEKFRPDIYLYENNKSMATAIRDAIDRELSGATRYLINSALVSAQNRERYYWTNVAGIPMPEDRGILLADALESGGVTPDGRTTKAYTLRASAGAKQGMSNLVRHIESGGQFGYQGVIEPVRIGTIESNAANLGHDSQQYRVYSPYGKAVTQCGNGGGVGAKTGLYAVPVDYAPPKDTDIVIIEPSVRPIYLVENGQITIKDKQYPIKLPDGYYIIRKLTVAECCRLQTLPDDYCRAVSATRGYQGLGNGWTAEVIIHLLRHALRGVPIHTPIEVLSMYDGIGTGRYCLDRLGYRNVTYYAYEIDPYAIKVAQNNYPDIIQCGDAFAVRGAGWGVGRMTP